MLAACGALRCAALAGTFRTPPIASASESFLSDWSRREADPLPDAYLKPSLNPGQNPPTIAFSREPGAVPGSELAPPLGLATPFFKVTSQTCEYYALRLPLLKGGFRRIPMEDDGVECNVVWGKSWRSDDGGKPRSVITSPLQRINHFPGSHKELGCKSGLYMNLDRFRSQFPERPLFVPATWCVPEHTQQLIALLEGSAEERGKSFIVKPAKGSCGRGISIVSGAELLRKLTSSSALIRPAPPKPHSPSSGGRGPQTPPTPPPQPSVNPKVVVQEYIDNPMLLRGRKFDFRLYVAVTSFDPLVVYLHKDGLARFAAHKYSDYEIPFDTQPASDAAAPASDATPTATGTVPPEVKGVDDYKFTHLTNYSIGRRLEVVGNNPEGGAPLDLKAHVSSVHKEIQDAQSIEIGALWEDVKELVVLTLLSVQEKIRRYCQGPNELYTHSSFELYGFDIMLTDDNKPLLIEVNTLPSLESSSDLDYNVKSNVVTDLLNMLLLQPFNRSSTAFRLAGYTIPGPPQGAYPYLTGSWGQLLQRNERALVERFQDEAHYSGGFERIFPLPGNLQQYKALAAKPSRRSEVLWGSL